MAMLENKYAHELSYCTIWRSRLQLFRSVIRVHLILFGQKSQTLKRKEVCECVWGYGHDWISLIHLVSLQELCIFNLLREFVVVLIHLVQHADTHR